MTKLMYSVPSDPSIREVRITRACVEKGSEPTILRDSGSVPMLDGRTAS
jgi:ATP-dependent protease Clp ATPase subunit